MSDDRVFQLIDSLPEELIPTSSQVAKFSGKYILFEGDAIYFDWRQFKTAIDDYRGDDMSFDKYNRSNVNQYEQEVRLLVDKITKFLYDAFAASIDIRRISATILNVLINLREESETGYLQFTPEGNNSSWEYRLIFSVPFGESAPSYFYSLITTIRITADIADKSGWWGFSSSTRKNFGAQIDALQLVVRKGFRAPW